MSTMVIIYGPCPIFTFAIGPSFIRATGKRAGMYRAWMSHETHKETVNNL